MVVIVYRFIHGRKAGVIIQPVQPLGARERQIHKPSRSGMISRVCLADLRGGGSEASRRATAPFDRICVNLGGVVGIDFLRFWRFYRFS